MATIEKEKILIVDDSEMNRSILADMLSDDYDILEASDGAEAVGMLRRDNAEISLVLLDIVMPRVDGFKVLEVMNLRRWIEDVPVIMVSAENSPSQVERAYDLGVTDFITRPFDALIVRRRVVNTLLLYAKQKKLRSMVEEQIQEKERRSDLMINILSHVVEFRNGESGLHIIHVRTLTEYFLHALSLKTDQYKLTDADIDYISTGSALHDIGKIAIDEKILNKPGPLNQEEFEIMKTHSIIGARMLEDIPLHKDDPLVKRAYEICRWHHERYDGKGYPDGLKGDDIPIAAQVVALADVYDALTSERVYKEAIPHEEAVKMILEGKCGAFNPLLLECLEENAERIHRGIEGGLKTIAVRPKIGASERGTSERTLRLLDQERVRSTFFASMTEAIQLEYTVSPPMIKLSAWGAKKLGLDEIIMDPIHDERLQAILGENNWKWMADQLRATSPQDPEVRLEVPLHFGGVTRWHRIIARAIWSHDEPPRYEGAMGMAVDIHDDRKLMQELEQKAARDPLTGILNRTSAKEQITQTLQERPDSTCALVIFDLDYFKAANDTYGHPFGDSVLKQVVERLRASVRRSDICGRVGGDEFVLFLEYKTDIEKTVDRIFHSLCGKFGEYDISVTMGVALTAAVGRSFEALYNAADTALYAAKWAGRRQYRFYDLSLRGLVIERQREKNDAEADAEGEKQ